MKIEKKQRDFGLELARAAAGTLTLSVHFFLNNGFYNTPLLGKSMLAACVVRMACMTCVPLFLLLTGYLCVNRKWGKGYYRRLLPILLTYLLAGAVCMGFRYAIQGNEFTGKSVLQGFTSFSAAPYGWYVEMYIGLFLLSPFFNAAWHALERGGRRALMLSLVVLTALPGLVNQYVILLPDWWVDIYPLAYYAVGAWLRENPIRIKGWKLLLCWIALAAALGLKGYFAAQGGSYVGIPEDQWESLTLMVQAVLLFSGLRQCGGEGVPVPIRGLVGWVAKLSLGMYLVSFVPDQLIYPILNQAVTSPHLRIWWMPVTVLTTILCSLALAQPIDWAVGALMRILPTKSKNAQES